MLSSTPARAAVLALLLVAQAGLLVWFGTLGPAPAMGAYPSEEHLAEDYDAYLGQRVEVSGRVVATDPVVVAARFGDGTSIRLTVRAVAGSPDRGDDLRVFGVVEPDHTVRALNVVTVPPSGYVYTYVVSFLAGLWVLGRLLRQWRLDTSQWGLVPRGDEDA